MPPASTERRLLLSPREEPMAQVTRSGKLYQERMQPAHRKTRRTPAPHHDMGLNAAHGLTLHPPYPPPEVLHLEDNKPPDSGLTEPWPFGSEEIS
jgi:hypothetical protein